MSACFFLGGFLAFFGGPAKTKLVAAAATFGHVRACFQFQGRKSKPDCVLTDFLVTSECTHFCSSKQMLWPSGT